MSDTEVWTEEKLAAARAEIDAMTQEQMARLWRYAPSGHPFFDRRLPLYDYFNARFKGFTPEISKRIGW